MNIQQHPLPTDTRPTLRRRPTTGTIIRIPLSEELFAYGCAISNNCMWVYDFWTKLPARGELFFPKVKWRFATNYADIPMSFENCGRLALEKDEHGRCVDQPQFYHKFDPEFQARCGFATPYAVSAGSGYLPYREVSLDEIKQRGLHQERWLEWHNYESIFAEWLPQMEVREVPPEFIDRAAPSGTPKKAAEEQEPEPQEVELLIVIPAADMSDDEPEQTVEEPLEEALEEAGCGSAGGSGTVPGAFEINVDTTRAQLRRCLTVIRRVLKKAKAPVSTRILELTERGGIEHPLVAVPQRK